MFKAPRGVTLGGDLFPPGAVFTPPDQYLDGCLHLAECGVLEVVDASEAPKPVKRGRGRPRKVPLPEPEPEPPSDPFEPV
jgi:hypothetical protein